MSLSPSSVPVALVLTFVLGMEFCPWGQTAGADAVADSIELAATDLSKGDPESAERRLVEFLRHTSNRARSQERVEATLLLADVRLAMAAPEAALRALNELPAASRHSVVFRESLATVLLAAQRGSEAEKILVALVDTRQSAGAAFRLGVLRFERGEHRPALLALEIARDLEPDDYYASIYTARSRLETGDLAAARTTLESIRQTPRSPEVEYLLGRVEAKEERWDAAIVHFEKALATNPDYLECVFALGGALRRRGDVDRARATLARFKELHHADWKRLQRASEVAQECARRTDDPQVWIGAARFHLEHRDPTACRESAWKCLRLDAKRYDARLLLARALRIEGEYSFAAVQLQKILRDAPQDSTGSREARVELKDLVEKHARR